MTEPSDLGAANRLRELAEIAKAATEYWSWENGERQLVDVAAFSRWKTRGENALVAIVGEDHYLISRFRNETRSSSVNSAEVGAGMLLALADDIDSGYLTTVRTRIAREVFSDFLGMAEHLLELKHGYVPAASLIGAVIEDALRRVATLRGLKIKPNQDLSELNAMLASPKVAAFNREQRREIEWWKSLRDAAAHERFTDLEATKVTSRLEGARRFVAIYLS